MQALRSEPKALTPADIAKLDTLLWTATLQKLPAQFAALPRRQRQAAAVDGSGGFLPGLLRRMGLWRKS